MKIVATSDLHGTLPSIPKCDLLLIAGDICPVHNHKLFFQDVWLRSVFAPWLRNQPARKVVGCWGNHDWIGEKDPPILKEITMLTDEMLEFEGLRIWGSPWQRRFCDWAFNLDEPELNLKYEQMPDCDIIVSHGPPYGYGDRAPRGSSFELTGNQTFLRRIDEMKPKLVVFGHIHCDKGTWTRGGTILSNVSFVNQDYYPSLMPQKYEIWTQPPSLDS
jgi:Icc-related predicted phosphoesterase